MIHKEAASLDSLEADVCSSNNSSAIAYSFLVDSLEYTFEQLLELVLFHFFG